MVGGVGNFECLLALFFFFLLSFSLSLSLSLSLPSSTVSLSCVSILTFVECSLQNAGYRVDTSNFYHASIYLPAYVQAERQRVLDEQQAARGGGTGDRGGGGGGGGAGAGARQPTARQTAARGMTHTTELN
jgi:hypothetical protein